MDFHGPDVLDEDIQERLKTNQKYLGAVIECIVVSFRRLSYSRRPQAEDGNYDDERLPPLLPEPPVSSVGLREDPVSAATIVQHTEETKSEPVVPLRRRLARLGSSIFQTFTTPCSLSIVLSFIISTIPVLKALFVPDVPGVTIPTAPDGQPPLAIVLNTLAFIGDASVPLGLMTLGSALARLEVPNGRLRSLPLGAVSALAIGRMVIMPVLGVLITRGLTRVGLLDAKDNVLQFVCMCVSVPPVCFLSGH